MNKIITMALIALMFMASWLTISVDNEVSATETYDYEPLTKAYYDMGNEYNNYTYMSSVDFKYDYSFMKPFEPEQTGDSPTNIARVVTGDFARINNVYYKFIFDNTDTIKLFKSVDFNSFRSIDNTVGQTKVEVELTETLDYASYRMPLTFAYNNTLRLIITDFGTGNIVMYNVSLDGEILSYEITILETYSSYNYLYPQSVVYLNETFYLFYSALDGNQDGRYAYGDSLTNLTVNSTWIIDSSITGTYVNIHNMKYYKDNNGEYFYISSSNKNINNMGTTSLFSHIILKMDDKFSNTSAFNAIYWDNDTSYYSYTYIPIGNNLYRTHYNMDVSQYLIWHYRGENKVCYDTNAFYKFYYNGLMESGNITTCEINSYDYFHINRASIYMDNFNDTITGATFYLQLVNLDLTYKTYSNSTLLVYKMYICDIYAISNIVLETNFISDMINTYDNLYGIAKSDDGYTRFCTGADLYQGIRLVKKCSITYIEASTYPSIKATFLVNPQDLGDIITAIIIETPLETKIGAISMIIGAIMALAPNVERKFRGYGALIFLTGVFLLTGMGLLGLIL